MGASSRYGITSDDLIDAAKSLRIGEGIADKIDAGDADEFIILGEYWAEEQVSPFLGVPLKPTNPLGSGSLDTEDTKQNYPVEFIQAIIYFATGRLLHSEYFENEPNISQAGDWAEARAWEHILNFKDRPTTRVGAGRRRNPNPFMPPSIAPPKDREIGSQQQ